jgi:hypothetical protein
MPKRTPVNIVVVLEGSERVVVTTFNDGEVTRKSVDSTQTPRRRPRRPIAKTRIVDHTRKK